MPGTYHLRINQVAAILGRRRRAIGKKTKRLLAECLTSPLLVIAAEITGEFMGHFQGHVWVKLCWFSTTIK